MPLGLNVAGCYNPHMEIKSIRHNNLRLLLSKYSRQKDFATEAGMVPSYISQLANKTRDMGNVSARRIEKNLNLPYAWMDQLNATLPANFSKNVTNSQNIDKNNDKVGSLAIKKSGKQSEELLFSRLGEFEHKLRGVTEAPVVGYIKVVKGKAMLIETDLGSMNMLVSNLDVRCLWEDSGEFAPKYDIGEILILHPASGAYAPAPRHNMFITMVDGAIIIRKMVAEDEQSYFVRAVTPDGKEERVQKSDISVIETIIGTYHPSEAEARGIQIAGSPYIPPKGGEDKKANQAVSPVDHPSS